MKLLSLINALTPQQWIYVAIAAAVVVVAIVIVAICCSHKRKKSVKMQQTVAVEPKIKAEPFKPEIIQPSTTQRVVSATPVVQEQPKPAIVETETQGVLVIGEEEVLVRYNRSFTSKLMQASDELKSYYVDLTNYALGYKKVKNKISWPSATLKRPGEKLATLTIKGKTLYVYLAMDPEVAKQTIKGTIKDVSDKRRYQDVPTLFKVKSALSLRKAKTLLDALFASKGIEIGTSADLLKTEDYPYDTTENLIKKGLIKVRAVDGREIEEGKILRTAGYGIVASVTAEQAHNMIADEVASTLVKTSSAESVGARAGKKFAVNIDTLSQNFASGDVVTLDVLKQKGIVPKKEVAIKILARGTLDKVLTVEADAFSLDAIKMIVLVGGTAIRK